MVGGIQEDAPHDPRQTMKRVGQLHATSRYNCCSIVRKLSQGNGNTSQFPSYLLSRSDLHMTSYHKKKKKKKKKAHQMQEDQSMSLV